MVGSSPYREQSGSLVDGRKFTTKDTKGTMTHKGLGVLLLMVAMTGGAYARGLSVDPSSVDFGTVPVGARPMVTIRVGNPGPDTLRLQVPVINGGGGFDVPSPVSPIWIGPGDSTQVSVRFTPGDSGCIAARLVLSSDKGDTSVDLRACGSYSPPLLGVDSLDFGPVIAGECALKGTTYRNITAGVLKITKVTDHIVTQMRTTASPSIGTSYPKGDTWSFLFQFCPDVIGPIYDTLRVISDAGIREVRITGQGIADTALPSSLMLDVVAGRVGDTLRLACSINPPFAENDTSATINVIFSVDPEALHIVRIIADSQLSVGGISFQRLGNDRFECQLQSAQRTTEQPSLFTIELVGLSTGNERNPVRLESGRVSRRLINTLSDGAVLLSGCNLGPALALGRRGEITSVRHDPLGESLVVQCHLPEAAAGTLRIVNMAGIELLRREIEQGIEREMEIRIDTESLVRGGVVLQLLIAGEMTTVPIIVGDY